jgi:hypothetical protein
LRVFRDEITASSAHVFCVVHHSGGGFKNALSQFIKPFAEQKRITLIALGGHVHQSIVGDLREWADDDDFPPYTEIPVETLVPVRSSTVGLLNVKHWTDTAGLRVPS